MNNMEFEKINRKLDMIFDMVMDIKREYNVREYDRELDVLKHKKEDAEKEYTYRVEDKKYVYKRFEELNDCYRDINRQFSHVEPVEHVECCER